MDHWYLEKSGKYYGPIPMEKLKKYAGAGTITPKTIISDEKSGGTSIEENEAVFSELKDFFRVRIGLEGDAPDNGNVEPVGQKDRGTTGKSTSRPVKDNGDRSKSKADKNEAVNPSSESNPSEAGDMSPEGHGLRKEWFLLKDDKSYGPYDLNQLRVFLNAGKLKPDARLRRGNTRKATTLGELIETLPVLPPIVDNKREPRHIEPPKVKRYSIWKYLVLLVPIVFVGLVVWFAPKEQRPPEEPPDPVQLKQRSKVRRLIETRPFPPARELFEEVLSYGMNLKYQAILENYREAVLIYEENGPVQYDNLLDKPVSREVAFRVNSGYQFTYLFDDTDTAEAAVISRPTFAYVFRENYSMKDDFSPEAVEIPGRGGTVWRVEAIPGMLAEAVWLSGDGQEGSESLAYLVIMNKP